MTFSCCILKQEQITSPSASTNREAGEPQGLHLPRAGPRAQQQPTPASSSHPPKYFPLWTQRCYYTSHSLLPGQPELLGKLLCRLLLPSSLRVKKSLFSSSREAPWLVPSPQQVTTASPAQLPTPQSSLPPHHGAAVGRSSLPLIPNALHLVWPGSRLLRTRIFQGEKALTIGTWCACLLCPVFMHFSGRNHSRILCFPKGFWELCGTSYYLES